ncbi:MAG: peptidase domain-containing ABC transporter [Firmicutes bacterium]|nr:peptidase domain-containing ABC transporter [Bacillota bacterium]MCM1400681.1 peptidase domain-containing ABC transporter [Bacteroides sp.]MCM1476375.1 peptidase domain-containing ABC transporter [Bacteroides sp.]
MGHFPDIRQHDAMECGVACLTAVLRHFGKYVSLSEVGKRCARTNEGVSLLSITRAAESYGLTTATARVSLKQLSELPMPVILHWNQNHFVTLYRFSRNSSIFHIADPEKGLIKLNRTDFASHWLSYHDDNEEKGIAMFVQPGEDFSKISEENKSDTRSLTILLKHIAQYKPLLIQVLLGLALGCVLQLVMPFLTQAIVDKGIAHKSINLIWLILLGELFIVCGRTATDFIRRWLILHISMRVNISLLSEFIMKLLRLPMSVFDTKLAGDLLQRMADHNRVQTFLTSESLSLFFSVLTFIIFGGVLAFYDWLIFLIFTAGSLIYVGWIALFLQPRKHIDYDLFECQSENQNKTFQLITSIQEIKLQGCQKRRQWEWEDVQANQFAVQMKALKLQQNQEAGSIFINEIKNISITVIAATAVINGQITLGAMLAIQYIVGQLNSPVQQFMSMIYSLQDVKLSLERINEIHNKEEDSDDGKKIINGNPSITLKNLSFSYNPYSPNPTLKKINLIIEAGKVTALVGVSGSGKTTLIKLLLGYYPPASGTLKIGGEEIGKYNIDWWRSLCGVVMQDSVIFSESIAKNIAISDESPNRERLEWATKLANIHEFIMNLPLKYETKVGVDGISLSQGQRQRLLIARAVYKNPLFIFLDEATNALDTENERTIVENLTEFYKGRTVVIVAHRLSTVRNADKIAVIDKGQIVEYGNHTDLIKKRGTYFKLIRNQLELGC